MKIIWVVLFAFLIQKEIPSIWTVFCCLALIGGTIMVSLDFSKAVSFSYRVILSSFSFFCELILVSITSRSCDSSQSGLISCLRPYDCFTSKSLSHHERKRSHHLH